MDGVLSAQSLQARHRLGRGEQVLENENTSMQEPSKHLPADSNICNDCSQLDLLGALQKANLILKSHTSLIETELCCGIRIAHVGHRFRQPLSTDCALCSILVASRVYPDQSSIANDGGDEIRLIGFLNYSGLLQIQSDFRKHDSAFLAVVPSQFGSNVPDYFKQLENYVRREGAAIIHQDGVRPAMFSAQEVSDVFDATIVNTWMQYCKSNHTTSCGSSKSALVSGLRLIDCGDLSITEMKSNKPYVALSYVWGKPCDVNSTLRRAHNRLLLPAKLSAVIFDAISVTKALGFQYLWVDRFCIDQNNPTAKHQQIRQMQAIYENADLVIVAAAGADETYGLPGVSQRPRTPQRTARFNGLHVISTMKDAHFSIRSSRWASRGWTFQEAALSRRRLVFTDEQLYFECNAMSCSETLHSQLDKLHQEDKSKSLGGTRAGMFSIFATGMRAGFRIRDRSGDKESFNPTLRYWNPVAYEITSFDTVDAYFSSIEEYSSRELSYDSDSLNAFQGIIQRYSRLGQPFNAIWGMPYSAQVDVRYWYFCCALSWNHKLSCFKDSKSPQRRPGFPSWTWAGWKGAVYNSCSILAPYCKVAIQSIRFGDRGEKKEEELNSLDYTTSNSEWRVLRLLANALRPHESWKPEGDGSTTWDLGGSSAILLPSEECMLETLFVEELMDVGKWRCIWICSIQSTRHVMILKRNQDTNTWKRAGMMEIFCGDQDMHDMTAGVELDWYEIE